MRHNIGHSNPYACFSTYPSQKHKYQPYQLSFNWILFAEKDTYTCNFWKMENLPEETILQIYGSLETKDLHNCAKIAKRFRSICFDTNLSYKHYLQNKMREWLKKKFPKVEPLADTAFFLAIPAPSSQIWHYLFTEELRNRLVFMLFLAKYPRLESHSSKGMAKRFSGKLIVFLSINHKYMANCYCEIFHNYHCFNFSRNS